MTYWAANEGVCVDCGQSVAGPRMAAGVCPGCDDDPPTYVLLELAGHGGQRLAKRIPKVPTAASPRPRERARGRLLEQQARAEGDLRWYYTMADGDLGLRAIRLETDMLAPVSMAVVRNDAGTWKPKPTRSLIVRGMTAGQLLAANRCRRVTRTLRAISRDHGRVLQRRFELVYYPDLEIPFGEWAGIVDFLVPSAADLCRPREGKKPDPQIVLRYTEMAKDAYHRALAAYMRSA